MSVASRALIKSCCLCVVLCTTLAQVSLFVNVVSDGLGSTLAACFEVGES